MANFLYNYSLLTTTVSSSTIISNLSGPFTLLFSWLAGIENVSRVKISGLIIGFVGVCIVGLQDESEENSSNASFIGDIVAFFAAAGYGLYTTVLKTQVVDDERVSMQLVFGYLGLINSIILLPILVILIVTSSIDLNKVTWEIIGFLLVGGFLDNALSDYLWARSVVLTSPTVATVGLSFTIPLAMISDALLGKEYANFFEILGSVFVVFGFMIVNSDHDQNMDRRSQQEPKIDECDQGINFDLSDDSQEIVVLSTSV